MWDAWWSGRTARVKWVKKNRWPTVLLVGKSNVGKSTLFNKLIGRRKSIVADEPGTTRDAVVDRVSWFGKEFTLVDTCGIFEGLGDEVYEFSRRRTLRAIEEADLVLFLVDGRSGLSSEDHTIADVLRKANVETVLVATKVENEKVYAQVQPELFSLGFGEPLPVSAEQGRNLDELVELIVSKLEDLGYDLSERPEVEGIVRVAIAGRPNAGKSSLFNMIIKQERAIVTSIPGTTRDTLDELISIDGRSYLFVDTAGLRRKSRVDTFVERISTLRTVEAIERSDVVLIVIDANEGVTRQDQRIAGLAEKRGKGTVIVLNKWDLVEFPERRAPEYIRYLREKLYFVSYSPIVFTSATRGVGYRELLRAINVAYDSLNRRVPTSAVNAALHRMIAKPPGGLKINYGLQVDTRPPTFLFFVNKLEVPESFQQTLRRTIREQVDAFEGAPIFLKFKLKS